MKEREKEPKRKGWLIIIAISLGSFLWICIIISSLSDNKQPVTATSDTSLSNETTVDSVMLKYNDSLRVEAKKELDVKLKRFNTKYDDIEGTTWIYSKSRPKYSNTMAFFNYIGLKDDGRAWKRLVIRYHGNDWLFINSIIIKTDSQTYTVNASDAKRDHNADVWEWIDIPEDDIMFVIINDVINSKAVKIRFVGSQYHKDWVLPQKDIKALREIEDYYQLLNSYYVLNKD